VAGLPRRRSLFWTLGGAFLGVLLLATALQALVVVGIVEPATRQLQENRAEFLVERSAPEIEAALAEDDLRRVARAIRAANDPSSPQRLVLRTIAGRWILAQSGGRGWQRRLERAWRAYEGAEALPAPPAGRGPGPPPDRAAELEVTVARTLSTGAVLCVMQPRRPLRIVEFLPRQALIFLPVALLIAAVAGLFLSHRLQRRLQRLETLAARVEDGDLTARIPAPGDDEIGRLGRRLNAMTASLEAARDEIDAVQGERRQLLADISHDLATPLTAIRGYAETLLDPGVDLSVDDRERYLRDVLHASERMDRLLADLLELGRLEAGTTELVRVDLDLASLARHSVERFRPIFEREGLRLAWSGPDDPVEVHADGLRLEQVLDNLLGNALRHVPRGGRVEVGVEGEQAAVLTVTDDGPGFGPTDLPRVFDRFYRGDRSRSTPGTGLGLAIVREIVERHGGAVRAMNVEPRGARLVVELPRVGR